MKPYQEQLLKLAGFKESKVFRGNTPHKDNRTWDLPDGDWLFMWEIEELLNSLDWLEEYIMPAVRGKYGINEVSFYYEETGIAWCDLIKHKDDWANSLVYQSGNTLATALNNALEELVK